jgi:hypothetical protein
MTNPPGKRGLFIVVADLDSENVIKTLLLKRQKALQISLNFINEDLLRYAGRDSGCFTDAVDILRPMQRKYHRAMIIFDRVGSGGEDRPATKLEAEIENRLIGSGWLPDCIAAVVIDPELEAWVWSSSPHVSKVLGWKAGNQPLQQFLAQDGLWPAGQPKPSDPKRAMEKAVRKVRQPFVTDLFSELAATVSVVGCKDRAFMKFVQKLQC